MYGCPLEYGGLWTHATRLPCTHQKTLNLQVPVTKVLKTTLKRRKLVGGLEFEKMGVATLIYDI